MTDTLIDPATGEIIDDTIEHARRQLGAALTFLAAEAARLTDDTDFPALARALLVLRDLKQDAATIYSDLEALALTLMGDHRVEVTGLGVFESHRRTKRTGWDHDALVADVLSAAAGEFEEVADLDPWEAVRALRECISFGAGKVTGLRSRGLQPDEYCAEKPDGWSLQLPPRDHGQDVA